MDTISEAAGSSMCSVCGTVFPDSDLIQYGDAKICASCKPAFFQRLKEGVALPIGFNYAGFWKRGGAVFIDGIILLIINLSMLLAFGLKLFVTKPAAAEMPLRNTLTIVQYIISFGYEVFFIGKYGATLGKMALKIKVINADGSKVGYLKAAGRYFAKILSGIILAIGYFMAAFDDEKRALHDRICNTRVILKTKD
ncbi:MAG: RDD family protein [Smithella sp.]|jgi:uncharacterized RDD family membrane protein YckC